MSYEVLVMNRKFFVKTHVLIVMILIFVAGIVRAEDDIDPIIILNEGDLWQWNGSGNGLEQMTFWGYNQQPVLSPDGKRVAYMAWSPITVDALQREGAIGGGEVPGDIKVLDVTDKQEITIAAQPPDASFFTEGTADKAVIRSQPAWSPDGNQLSWAEYDYPGTGVNRVMVYDFATGATLPLQLDLPAQAGVPVPMEIAWGKSGIILRSTAVNPQNLAIFDDSFLVYDADGILRASISIPQTESRFMTSFVLLTYKMQEYIGVQYNTHEWDLFDPFTGESKPAPSAPELYVTTMPEKSLSVSVWPNKNDNGVQYQLLDVDGNPMGQPIDMGIDYDDHMGLSPDGRALAFVQYDPQTASYGSSVSIWNNGEVSARFPVNPLGFSFVWGPTAWRIRLKP
jgi:hypothetical protein